jgi:hypothetical protein
MRVRYPQGATKAADDPVHEQNGHHLPVRRLRLKLSTALGLAGLAAMIALALLHASAPATVAAAGIAAAALRTMQRP